MNLRIDPSKIAVLRIEAERAGRESDLFKAAEAIGIGREFGKSIHRSAKRGARCAPETITRIEKLLHYMLGRSIALHEFVMDEDLPASVRTGTE